MSLKKRKGIFYGKIIYNFIEENQFFALCHTNEMHIDTYIPIRKEFNNLNFGLKFIKRKAILNFFDKKSKYNIIKNFLNGSVAVIYVKKKEIININLFTIIKRYKPLILLGFYINNFYLISKGEKIIDKLKKKYPQIKNIFECSKKVKGLDFLEIFNSLFLKLSNVSFNYFTVFFSKSLRTLI